MKKIIILSFAIVGLFSSIVVKAEKKKSTQWGGQTHGSGADTYKIVEENDSHTNLHCEQPGTLSCCWMNGDDPFVLVSGNVTLMSTAYNYVLSMLAQNVLSGSVTDDNGINGYSWIASTPNDFEFTFDGR